MKKKITITYTMDTDEELPKLPEPILVKPEPKKCKKHKVMMGWVYSKKKQQWFHFHDHKDTGIRCWGNGYESNYQGIV